LRQSNLQSQLQYSNRVLLLGDSLTFGLGVEENETFASLIQPTLNRQGWGIINAGQPAFGTAQETTLGIYYAQTLRPKVIVLHMFLGETGSDFKDDYLQNYKKIDIKYGYKLRKDRWFRVPPVDYLRAHSYLWRNLGFKILLMNTKKIMDQFSEIAEKNPELVAENTFRSLDKLKAYCRENSIRFGVVIIAEKDARHSFYPILLNYLESQKITYLNLNENGFDLDDFFKIDLHWNPKGHQKAVHYIAPFIQNLINHQPQNKV